MQNKICERHSRIYRSQMGQLWQSVQVVEDNPVIGGPDHQKRVLLFEGYRFEFCKKDIYRHKRKQSVVVLADYNCSRADTDGKAVDHRDGGKLVPQYGIVRSLGQIRSCRESAQKQQQYYNRGVSHLINSILLVRADSPVFRR